MVKTLTEKAKSLGVDIRLQTPAKGLIKEKGRIAGVIAEDPGGTPLEIRPRAVILATGGFGNSAHMIREHIGFELGQDLHPFRIPGIEGDGIRIA